MDHCEECGFVYADVPAADLPRVLSGLGDRYATALGAASEPRRRPAERVWSPLEYACHVHDVLRVQHERLVLALTVTAPEFPSMGRDERAVADAYNEQDPAVVLADLADAAESLAARFAGLGPADLDRTGVYPLAEPTAQTMLWLGRHTVHEGEHHLLDIRRAG
ncbi:DinB family protein [Micromonospora costi]|uniref:DinB family protein n=1 Tax=Micromonospora costi TaxID=1530042 RepID=UPI00340328CF